jgi:hypothetical protein
VSRSQAARRRAQQEAYLAEQRAQAQRRRMRLALGACATVVGLIAVLVIVRLSLRDDDAVAATDGLTSSTVAAALASVPPSILDQVGRGAATGLPARIQGQPALTQDGRPLVLYVGAEYCPFCAAQRWGLVVALNRFGSFTGLGAANSAADDAFPGTATVTFHGARYTSPYLSFEGVELAGSVRRGGSYEPLDRLTPEQQQVLVTYNAPPYVPAASAGAVPFVDFGNRFLMTGSAFSPGLLKGLTHEQIAAALVDPASPVAQALLGAANAFTAALCDLTNGEPGEVCRSGAVAAYPEVARAGV